MQTEKEVNPQTVNEYGVLLESFTSYRDQGTPFVKIQNIKILSERGRKVFDKIPALADSMKQVGLINPSVVTRSKTDPTTFDLVAGERRLRALSFLSAVSNLFDEIPVLIRENTSERRLKEIELIENVEREELTWNERCTLISQIDFLKRQEHGERTRGASKTQVGWTIDKTAALVNMPVSTVQQQISAAKKIEERPDLFAKVKHLPMVAALKEISRIETVEKLEEKKQRGQLKLSNNFQNIDALSFLKTIPDNSIDLVLTDPPYGIEKLASEAGKNRGDSTVYLGVMKSTDNLDLETSIKLHKDFIPELFRVLKPSSHCYIFFGWEVYQTIVSSSRQAGFIVDHVPIIWYKGRSTGPSYGYNFAQSYEPILYLQKPPQAKRLTKNVKNLLEFKQPSKEERIIYGNHPFQKPLDLLSELITLSTNIGDTVLDPFAGSGSTLIAASNLSRSYFGSELDPERFLLTSKTLSTLTPQP